MDISVSDFAWLSPTHSGTAKLVSSAVAPLVARARGYDSWTIDTVGDHFDEVRVDSKHSAGWRRTKEIVATGDALFMPWFRVDEVALHDDFSNPKNLLKPAFIQFRPRKPIEAGNSEKGQKYASLAGRPTVIDVHPSTPITHIRGAGSIMITEGLLKADSALTALLLDAGVSEEELLLENRTVEGEETIESVHWARKRLQGLLKKVDVLVVGLVGVGTWHNHPEWKELRPSGKHVYIGFDADVAVNRNVWRQAKALTVKMSDHSNAADVSVLRLPDVDDEKQGVDDFFASGHRWSDLLSYMGELPAEPESGDDDLHNGQWRVNPDGLRVDRVCKVDDTVSFETMVSIGGYVRGAVVTGVPSREEMESGVLDSRERFSTSDADLEIVVKWRDIDQHDLIHEEVITGPSAMLSTQPKDWYRIGAKIPYRVALHPQWPPQIEWLQAVKAHKHTDIEEKSKWGRMGWLPTESGNPEFIVGRQRISASGITSDAYEISAVTEDNPEWSLTRASSFGVVAPDPDVDWVEQAIEDAKEVVDVYLFGKKTWKKDSYGALATALMMRPAIPLRPKMVPYLFGPPASGKSWTVAAIFMGWQPRGGIWTNTSLPGSARDTGASTELSVSRAPLWVMDDLAPSVSRVKAEKEADALGDLIRSIHDENAKKRATRSMGSQKLHSPNALFMVTAENEPSIGSIMSRTAPIRFDADCLYSIEPVETLGERGVQARLVGAFIRWLATVSSTTNGWQDLRALFRDLQKGVCKDIADEVIRTRNVGITEGDLQRLSASSSDLMATLTLFTVFVRDIVTGSFTSSTVPDTYDLDIEGTNEEAPRWVRNLCKFLPGNELFSVIPHRFGTTLAKQENKKPGRAFIDAVFGLLKSGNACVYDLADPAIAPAYQGIYPTMLGWKPDGQGTFRPANTTIGYVTEKDGEVLLLLNPEQAFASAKRSFPELVPHGSSRQTVTQCVWSEGCASDAYGKDPKRSTVRIWSKESRTQLRLLPVPFNLGDAS